jgi:ABC-type transport system involved in multi-copper enzyme maturation permease subunit
MNYIVRKFLRTMPMTDDLITSPWHLVAYLCGFLFAIPAMIIIVNTCSEYTYRTHRQNVIDGMTRKQYVAAKLLFILSIALLTTVAVFASALVMGVFAELEISFDALKNIFYYFLQTTMYLCLAFLLALFLKRSILALGVFIAYSLILENWLEHKFNEWYLKTISDLLPLSACDHLISVPSKNFVAIAPGDPKSETVYLIATLAYIVVCCAICFYRYEKQDL